MPVFMLYRLVPDSIKNDQINFTLNRVSALYGHHEWQPDAQAMGTRDSTNISDSCGGQVTHREQTIDR